MFKLINRWWKYLTARLTGRFEERADPKVQLEQAIREAQDQHKRLKEQAANVIAHQKQTEMRLDRELGELERVNANARQAVTMAEDARAAGDDAKVTQYTSAAEAFATKMIALESEIEGLKTLHFQASQAADDAKAAVQSNSNMLQQKLSERNKLLGQLDQAKMQEQLNDAMSTLNEAVGDDVPSFEEVREKIESRYAKAKGAGELAETSVEYRMQEIEDASRNVEAQARLDQIKAELGITSGVETATPTAESAATGEDAATATE